ncbi:hypothetical protein [Williamsia sp. R60]
MTKLVVALIAAASALVLATLATYETGALWSDHEANGATTVTSGTLILTADGVKSVTLSGFSSTALKPGDIRQKSFLLRNAGTTPLTYRLASAVVTGSPTGGMTVSASRMASGSVAADCDATIALPGTALPVNTTPAIALAPATSTRICLHALITNLATSGATYTATFTFTAAQA